MDEPKIKFSVITATYNAAAVLPRLISSLQTQTDLDFEWVVADGASTDETLALLESARKTLNVRVSSCPDFGIYDALNRAVKMCSGQYYLVVGGDDELFHDAIDRYKKACLSSKADFISALVDVNGKPFGVSKRKWEWLYGTFAHVGSHAVGLVIRKDLHDRFGFYSNKFPITADFFFILKAIHGGAVVHDLDFVAGRFSREGLSGNDTLGVLCEQFRIQICMGHGLMTQLLIFMLRVLKHAKSIMGRPGAASR